jgi:hypothetical protein
MALNIGDFCDEGNESLLIGTCVLIRCSITDEYNFNIFVVVVVHFVRHFLPFLSIFGRWEGVRFPVGARWSRQAVETNCASYSICTGRCFFRAKAAGL